MRETKLRHALLTLRPKTAASQHPNPSHATPNPPRPPVWMYYGMHVLYMRMHGPDSGDLFYAHTHSARTHAHIIPYGIATTTTRTTTTPPSPPRPGRPMARGRRRAREDVRVCVRVCERTHIHLCICMDDTRARNFREIYIRNCPKSDR